MCVIYDLSYLEMTLDVDELDILDIQVGQKAEITADAISDRTFEGVVTSISSAGTTSGGTTTYPVTIRIDETVTEYVCGDESFAAEHTIQLTGTLTRSMLAKPLFLGTLRISGVDALAEPVTLRLERQDGRWTGNFNDAYGQPLDWQQYGVLSIDADKDLGELLIRLTPDEAQQHFLAPGAASRPAAMTRLYTYYPSYRTK